MPSHWLTFYIDGCGLSVLPIKFVPLSERNSLSFTLTGISRRRALIKVNDDISSINSRCTAQLVNQVNKIAQRLLFTEPLLVLCVIIPQGPKASTPNYINEGDGFKHSGRLLIFWCSTWSQSFLHVYSGMYDRWYQFLSSNHPVSRGSDFYFSEMSALVFSNVMIMLNNV